MKAAANEIDIHNLGAGHGAAIRGSKALADIYTVSGAVNDIYINNDKTTPTYGHAYISDGNGTGASHWKDVGQLMGDKGDKGDTGARGLMGLGLTFEHAYADKATMIADRPNPELGEVHLTIDTGDLWVYDNPNPPHDAAGADWHDVGHVQGPQGATGNKGDKGDRGDTGPQGQPGAHTEIASQAEVDAGTVANKSVSPHTLKNASDVLHKQNGTMTVKIIPVLDSGVIRGAKAGIEDWSIGRSLNTAVSFDNKKSEAAVKLTDTGDVILHPKTGKKALVAGNAGSVVTGILSGTTLTLTL